MKTNLTKRIVISGLVAAIYAVLTIALAPISYGPIQFRLSEVMVLLAFVDPIYIIGLTLGCFIANIFGGNGMLDIVFGTLATLISCIAISGTAKLIKNRITSLFVASLFPTIFNGIIIGWVLNVAYGLPLVLTMVQVALGEFVVVTVVGVPVFLAVLSRVKLRFSSN